MLALFGHAWSSQYGTAADGIAAETWAVALAGVTGKQIADGLRATMALGKDFPPSAPRFRALCMNIPSQAMASRMIYGKESATPFSRHMWGYIDAYRFRTADMDKTDRMIVEAYGLTTEYLMQGGHLPDEPAAMLEAPHEEESTWTAEEAAEYARRRDEVAQREIQKLADLLRVEPAKPHTEVD
jgi:hypothetical protein